MNKIVLKAAVAFVLFVGAIGAYLYWQNIQSESASKVVITAPPVPTPKSPQAPETQMSQLVEMPVANHKLPKLAESDSFVLDGLAELIGNKSLMKLFHTELIIHNLVVTIDNLPRMKLPSRMMPVTQASGTFLTSGSEDKLIISPKNAARYTLYVKIAEAIDAKKLVEFYVRIYPLFQQAYQEVGYPNEYFNNRLMEVIDDLLDAPDIKEPVKLVQPHVLYKFADPEFEALSIGQRTFMRTGSQNEEKLKSKLEKIKQELLLQIHEKKLDSPE